jgi:hypothetical protein
LVRNIGGAVSCGIVADGAGFIVVGRTGDDQPAQLVIGVGGDFLSGSFCQYAQCQNNTQPGRGKQFPLPHFDLPPRFEINSMGPKNTSKVKSVPEKC